MLDGDERDWVPQSPAVWFKPLLLNVSQGYYINILQVRASGVLSRHRHYGPVHALTLRGTWHYLEHDWIASTGDYAFEPAGETHTLVVPDDVREWRRYFMSPAATHTSILMGSRWATRTCSPNLSMPAAITSRSASEKITSRGWFDDEASDDRCRRHPDQLSDGRRARSVGAAAARHLLEPGLAARAGRYRRRRACIRSPSTFRASGGSGGELTVAEASIPRLAAWLARFLDAMGNKGPVMVAGHDIGGGVAQHLLINRAVDVPRLALVNAVTYDSWPVPGIARFRDPGCGRRDVDRGRSGCAPTIRDRRRSPAQRAKPRLRSISSRGQIPALRGPGWRSPARPITATRSNCCPG